GNVTLTNLMVTDANAIVTGSPVSTLAPGASITLTAVHTLTQDDVDAGTYTNTATVTGKTTAGADVTDVSGTTEANNTPTVATITPAGFVTLVKTVSGTVPNKAGEVLNYNLVVKNTGNVTLTNLVVTDVNAVVTGSPVSTLAPGASITLTASHTLTQGDVDAGSYTNTASVNGKTPVGADVTDVSGTTETNDIPTVATLSLSPSYTFTKIATNTVNKAGDVINYRLILTNTGNVTLADIQISDDKADAGSLIPANIAAIAPGESASIIAKHTVTQSDVNSGGFINQAKASVKDSKGNTTSKVSDDPSTADLNDATITKIVPDPSVRFTKMIANSAGVVKVIEYSILVTNTGNITLTDIVVTDPGADAGSIRPALIAKLDPAETAIVSARHTLIQPEIDYGKFVNQATVNASFGTGANRLSRLSDDPATLAPNDPTVYLIPEAPAITLVKTGVLSADGNTIAYTFSIKNTGNVTLNHFQFSDAKLSSPVSFTPATIAPGEIATATAVYIITQTEKNTGTVRNTAKIIATAPSGTTVTDVSGTTENNDYPTIIEISKLISSKTVTDANNNGIAEAGETLTYTILVKNNGSTIRSGVKISDPIPTNTTYLTGSAGDGATLVGNVLNWNNLTIPANGQLAVSFKVQVNAVLASGNLAIENIATITDPGNAITVLKPSVSIPTEGKLEGSKSVADVKGNNDGKAQANEILTYSLTVRNTGGSPLNSVVITDELPAGLTYVAGSVSGYGTVSNNTLKWTINMQANSSTVLYFDAKVAPDVNSYNILKNVALMVSPTGAVVQPEAIIDVDQSADLVITKELITTGEIMTGSDVTYKITVTNKGANRATGVSVTDKLPTIIDAPKDITVSTGTTSYSSVTRDLVWMVGSLDLNQTATITFKSRTLAAGPLSNSATVKGDQPDPSMGNNYVLADGATIKGDELLIPNLFTPNGDGRNDTFEIRGLTEFAENEITIVNRWGNQVYHAKNYRNNWSGEGLNEGTYYYLVKVRKAGSFEWKVFSGYVTLIRAFKN
ncbi:gliding motility-associated C-terminal domain-containing protein, partial [Pedobacter sp. BMA]|uniref:DUF7507 domain-containing protein n=1 Tax=Pedobacter sp. BMA TaxID=1663685 RepID=UPI000A642C3A